MTTYRTFRLTKVLEAEVIIADDEVPSGWLPEEWANDLADTEFGAWQLVSSEANPLIEWEEDE